MWIKRMIYTSKEMLRYHNGAEKYITTQKHYRTLPQKFLGSGCSALYQSPPTITAWLSRKPPDLLSTDHLIS